MKNASAIAAIALAAGGALAGNPSTTYYDANVTNHAIWGSGNQNGGYTVNRSNGVELGLRARTRFDSNNQPQNDAFARSNGDGTYTFQAGLAPSGFGWQPGSTSTATWSFDWSINSDFEGTTGNNLSSINYGISIDFDPSSGTGTTIEFDPINGFNQAAGDVYWDHSIGTNATGNGQGVEAADAGEYGNLIGSNNLAQNSWNMEFFDNPGDGLTFDAREAGEYTITLMAFDDEFALLGMTSITVQVVIPLPTSGAMAGIGLLAIGARRRR